MRVHTLPPSARGPAAEEEDRPEAPTPEPSAPLLAAEPSALGQDSEKTVSVALFLACLRVTFIFEHHLMELRKSCFDKSKTCAPLLDGPGRPCTEPKNGQNLAAQSECCPAVATRWICNARRPPPPGTKQC